MLLHPLCPPAFQGVLPAGSRFSDIKRVNDTLEILLRQLEAQGDQLDTQPMLSQQILKKYPVDLVCKIEESRPQLDQGKSWCVSDLCKALSQYVTLQETVHQRSAAQDSAGSESRHGGGDDDDMLHTTQSLVMNSWKHGGKPKCT